MSLRESDSPRALANMTQNRLFSISAKVETWSLRVKEWYTPSYRTCDVGEHEPSWVVARRANPTHCAFYRLPEELVLQILSNLGNATKGTAQRTCGLFMRIMFDPTLDCTEPGWRLRASRRFCSDLHFPLLMAPDLDLLDRDRFCDGCLRFREDGRYNNAIKALQSTLWCSHCNEFHKRPVFASRQRAASPARRICVLAKGKAQICNHESIGSPGVEALMPRVEKPHQICRHREHRLSWGARWKFLWGEPLYPELEYHGRPHINLRFHKDLPLIITSRATVLLFKLHHRTPVTRAFLQERLIANAHTLRTMLCPHVTIDDGQLRLPFCPSRCACFDSPRWTNHICSGLDILCCICTATKLRGPPGYFLPENFYRQHSYKCVFCEARYRWDRYGSTVTLTIEALSGFYKPNLPKTFCRYSRRVGWVSKLHPEAWGILEDEELRHVAWCDDTSCATRWRWGKLSRLLVQPDQP